VRQAIAFVARSVLPLALVALAAGCAATASLACPARGGPSWREVRSPHFVLRTDLPPREAQAALAEFEQSYQLFRRVAFPSTKLPDAPIDFVLFSREDDFRALAPTGASGYFLPRQPDEIEATPAIAMFGRLSPSTKRRFQHELAHRFLEQRVRRAPPWLEEGIAEYWSTARVSGDEAVLGELPLQRVFATEIRVFIGLTERFVEERVPYGDIPPLAKLLALDGRAFHEPDHEYARYAASWALVHLLQNGSDGERARFAFLVDALESGESPEKAWSRAFGDVALDALDKRLRAYLLKLTLPTRRVPFAAPPPAAIAEARDLSDGEVHLLWARVRPWDSRENIVRAGADLAEAVAAAPLSTETRYWRALYHQRWRRFDAAEADLKTALVVAPRDAKLWLALAALRASRAVEDPRWLPAAVDAVARLAPLARTPRALDFVARFLADRDPPAALRFAHRAAATDPGCWDCRDTERTLQLKQESRALDDLLSFYRR